MKQIEPVQIWVNGEQKVANYLNAYIVNDNLIDSATFFYALISRETVDGSDLDSSLANGNVSIDGQEYDDWGNSGDVNGEAYSIIAEKLNLVLINP